MELLITMVLHLYAIMIPRNNPTNVLSIPLSKGGCLKVNRDNLGDLAKAIGMFSPEDINLIMRAIAQDTKIKEMQKEIDDVVNSIGE
jgi:hypothetical protein